MTHLLTPEFDCLNDEAQKEMECLSAELIPQVESIQDEFVDTEVTCLSEQFESRQERHAFDLDINSDRDPCIRNILANNARFCSPTQNPNEIIVRRAPAFKHREVLYDADKNRFCGTAEFAAMKCHYECDPDQLNDYFRACEQYTQTHDCRRSFPQPGYRVQYPDLASYDTIECALDKDYLAEIMKDCPAVEDIEDSVLNSLEEKLLCLKAEEKIHNAGLTTAEKIALYSIAGAGTLAAGAGAVGGTVIGSVLGAPVAGAAIGAGSILLPVAAATGIVYGVGALIRKIRSEKARRQKLGLDKDEFKRLKKLEKLGKKYGQEDFRITDDMPADFEAAIADPAIFDRFKEAYQCNLEEFKDCFVDAYGKKAWRKWKRYVKTKNKDEQTIIDAKARAEIAKTKNQIKQRESWLKDQKKEKNAC